MLLTIFLRTAAFVFLFVLIFLLLTRRLTRSDASYVIIIIAVHLDLSSDKQTVLVFVARCLLQGKQ